MEQSRRLERCKDLVVTFFFYHVSELYESYLGREMDWMTWWGVWDGQIGIG
jgi:hypothetical protein